MGYKCHWLPMTSITHLKIQLTQPMLSYARACFIGFAARKSIHTVKGLKFRKQQKALNINQNVFNKFETDKILNYDCCQENVTSNMLL